MYDFAHPLSDAIEGITHSICTLEFENTAHLRLVPRTGAGCPARRPEFARLNLNYTVMSKRKLLQLVQEGHVSGWDDPRMPTISACAAAATRPKRSATSASASASRRRRTWHGVALLEHCVREDLNRAGPARDGGAAAVESRDRELSRRAGRRARRGQQPARTPRWAIARCRSRACSTSSATISWRTRRRSSSASRPGKEVRLRCAYFITCTEVVKDDRGEIVELSLPYDPAHARRRLPTAEGEGDHALGVRGARARSRCGSTTASSTSKDPENAPEGQDVSRHLNPRSLETFEAAGGAALGGGDPGTRPAVRTARLLLAPTASTRPGRPVFNRTVSPAMRGRRSLRSPAHYNFIVGIVLQLNDKKKPSFTQRVIQTDKRVNGMRPLLVSGMLSRWARAPTCPRFHFTPGTSVRRWLEASGSSRTPLRCGALT